MEERQRRAHTPADGNRLLGTFEKFLLNKDRIWKGEDCVIEEKLVGEWEGVGAHGALIRSDHHANWNVQVIGQARLRLPCREECRLCVKPNLWPEFRQRMQIHDELM